MVKCEWRALVEGLGHCSGCEVAILMVARVLKYCITFGP